MNKIKPIHFFLGLGVLLSIFFSSGQIENPDTHLRLTQARILIEDGTYGLPRDVGEESHGNVAITNSGQRQMVYNPGQTALFAPVYLLIDLLYEDSGRVYYTTAFWVSFFNYIIHALCAYLLFKVALILGSETKKAYIVSLIFCLTSYSFTLAQSTYEHHFEMFFILLSVYFVLNKQLRLNILFAGTAISVGLLFRSTTLLAIPALLFLLNSNKQRIALLSFVLPGFLLVLYYNYFRFGNPFVSGYSIAWELAYNSTEKFWSIKRIPRALVGFLISPAKGLLIFSPTILIGLAGYKKFWMNHEGISKSVLVLCGCYLILFSMNFAWHGSIWSFGPRYILPIVPFLYLPLIKVDLRKWMYLFILFAFLGQLILVSVNYKRGVLEQYISSNGIDEQQYIFNHENIPYLVQWDHLMHILPKNLNGDLENYVPDSPWKKEIRTSSNQEVLESSIEKNSVNFWWVRIFHWETTKLQKVCSIIVLLGSNVLLFFCYRYVTSLE